MVEIVNRSEWGAREPKRRHWIATPTPRLWVHHTADDRQGAAAVRAHQRYHQDVRGWYDIAYSFLIDDSGTIYEGRGVGVMGGHTEGDNDESHAICLLGHFGRRTPTSASLDSLVALARHGAERGWWVPTLGGHRDAPGAQTSCPGAHLYAALPELRRRVHTEEDTMSAEDVEALKAHIDQRVSRNRCIIVRGDGPHWWITDGLTKRHVPSRQHADVLIYSGLAVADAGNEAYVWSQADVDAVPVVPDGDRARGAP